MQKEIVKNSPKAEEADNSRITFIIYILRKTGRFLIYFSIVFFLIVFYPVVTNEIKYIVTSPNKEVEVILESKTERKSKKYVEAVDKDFGIVIPKIGANAKVIPNVNPYDSGEYQETLTKGVAHAEGTVFPGQVGNTFLFSHSSVNFYEAARYNSVFYLLNKIKKGDIFYLTYQNKIYKYEVIESKIVSAEEIEYMKSLENTKTATLMTCWPAGTTLKRLVVIGELSGN